MYGLLNKTQLQQIALEVVTCLGNGSNNTAIKMLLETAGAETGRGVINDKTKLAGMGITQFDWVGFNDTLTRTRTKDKEKIDSYFGINIDWVSWEELRYNPLLSMIFTRLKYKLIPEPIPSDIKDRAKYWKKHYNTKAGKGTVEHYLEMNQDESSN